MKYFSFAFLLLSFSTVQTFAKNESIYFGGGGDPDGATTIFDTGYQSYMENLKSKGWTVQSYFDGGHSGSEELAQKMSNGTNQPLTSNNMADAIRKLKTKINNGELSSGDQLLITIDTHGAKNDSETTHLVATSDGQFNLDFLLTLRNLAEKKGIKLAIIDTSCFSGNTLALATDKTCVITMSTASALGWDYDANALFRSMHLSGNLEAAYLGSRAVQSWTSSGAPQISTPAGKIAGAQTEALSRRMDRDKFPGDELASGVTCASKSKEELEKLISNLQNIDKDSTRSSGLAPELRQAFDEYQKLRDDAENTLKEANEANKTVCVRVLGYNSCSDYRDYLRMVNLIKKEYLTSENQEILRIYEQVTNSPGFAKFKISEDKFKVLTKQIQSKAYKVAKVERKAYREIYDANMKDSNPCRDFKL